MKDSWPYRVSIEKSVEKKGGSGEKLYFSYFRMVE